MGSEMCIRDRCINFVSRIWYAVCLGLLQVFLLRGTMNQAAEELLQTLVLKETEKDVFAAPSQDLGWGAVYGGQFLAQGILASQKTVKEDRTPHSMHAYFLHRAFANDPIIYRVERLRDGRSFSSRRLLAYQKDTLVFSMQVGFHVQEEGLEAQLSVETRGAPDDLSLIHI